MKFLVAVVWEGALQAQVAIPQSALKGDSFSSAGAVFDLRICQARLE